MLEIIPFPPDLCRDELVKSSDAHVRVVDATVRVVDTLIQSEIIVARQLEKGGLEYKLA